MFHYRGTWGSGGEFSMSNVLEDTAAALSHVRGLGPDANWRVDAKRIVLVGHSLGGFAALVTGASDADVRGIVSISGADMGRVGSGLAASQNSKEFWTRFFKSANAVNVSNIDALLEQWSASADNWQFEKLPQRLGKRSVLLVVATKDTVTVPATHHTPLASALKTSMGAAFTEVSLDTDHSYSDRRIALTRAVIGWLEANK
jgi:pimeloyl-ACP methyl ester carboxylesterase